MCDYFVRERERLAELELACYANDQEAVKKVEREIDSFTFLRHQAQGSIPSFANLVQEARDSFGA